MRLKYIDSQTVYTGFSFDEERGVFSIFPSQNATEENIIEYVPALRLIQDYNPDKFGYCLLSNSACSENSIFQVYDKPTSTRMGWVFPIQALLSSEHDYKDNEYFLRYAYTATILLLKEINEQDMKMLPEEFSIGDYYDNSKSILVYDMENCGKIHGFHIDNYIVNLYKYGYSFSDGDSFDADLTGVQKRINLYPLSDELSETPIINALFRDKFSTARAEITRFYFYYQIVEILISIVFRVDFHAMLNKLDEDTDNLMEVRDQLGDITREKERVKRLFNTYARNLQAEYITNLNISCIRLLEQNGRHPQDECYKNLYAVRCFLVHSLYLLKDESKSSLKAVNDSFVPVLVDILVKFKKPES